MFEKLQKVAFCYDLSLGANDHWCSESGGSPDGILHQGSSQQTLRQRNQVLHDQQHDPISRQADSQPAKNILCQGHHQLWVLWGRHKAKRDSFR